MRAAGSVPLVPSPFAVTSAVQLLLLLLLSTPPEKVLLGRGGMAVHVSPVGQYN
jgi:hypothetical protein